MLDIILIQYQETGISILEYRQEHTKFREEHSDIFSGFLTAIHGITQELDIGTPCLISTEGSRGHNCIIVHKPPINVILLVDNEDPINLWREQGMEIAQKFIEKFGTEFNSHDISIFKDFIPSIKDMCSSHEYCS